jgi:AraC family transcriptional regulator, arabinose operon regulatory protein
VEKVLRDEQLRVFWMSRIDYEKNTGVRSHFHDDLYQFLYLIDGEGTIHINDETYELLPKHAYFISKRYKHRFYFTRPSSTIDLKFDMISNELENLFKADCFPVPYFMGDSPKLKELFKLSVMNLKNSSPLIPYRIDVGFKDILLAMIQENSFIQDTSPRSMYSLKSEFHPDFPVIDYLLENLQSRITLEDIAKHFNFHPHYIIDLFRKKFDTTPMKLLQELRIEKSKEYLEFSNYTVTEIAELVGLSAPYFSRLFHSKEGISPTEYREQARTVVGKHILLEEDFSPSLKKQPEISKDIL